MSQNNEIDNMLNDTMPETQETIPEVLVVPETVAEIVPEPVAEPVPAPKKAPKKKNGYKAKAPEEVSKARKDSAVVRGKNYEIQQNKAVLFDKFLDGALTYEEIIAGGFKLAGRTPTKITDIDDFNVKAPKEKKEDILRKPMLSQADILRFLED